MGVCLPKRATGLRLNEACNASNLVNFLTVFFWQLHVSIAKLLFYCEDR